MDWADGYQVEPDRGRMIIFHVRRRLSVPLFVRHRVCVHPFGVDAVYGLMTLLKKRRSAWSSGQVIG